MNDLGQLSDLSPIGWMYLHLHLHVLDVVVFAVKGRVAALGQEGLLAFLGLARLRIGAVNDSGLLLLAVDMLAQPSRAGDDRGIDDHPGA